MTEIYIGIGKRLRKHRRLMRFTQKEVADKLGFESTATISRWERGITIPSMENAMMLSKLYKTLLNELFWELDRDCGKQLFPHDPIYTKGSDP